MDFSLVSHVWVLYLRKGVTDVVVISLKRVQSACREAIAVCMTSIRRPD